MLIIVVILDQLSYDEYNSKKDWIFRIQLTDSLSNVGLKFAATPYPLASELVHNYSFVEKAVVMNSTFEGEGVKNQARIALKGLYTSSDFFRVFDFRLKSGNPEKILDEPYTVVLTEEIAGKFFGDQDPVGQFLQVDSLGNFLVTGVLARTKKKSHIQFEALVSLSTFEAIEIAKESPDIINNWNSYWSSYIYLLLKEGTDMNQVQQALDNISTSKYKDYEKHNCSFYLQPLKKIVPGPMLANEMGFFLPYVFVLFLSGLALVIIISAAFNYTSLSLARSLLRAKEVGVRKTIGASPNHLIIQFLLEAIVIAMISLILACGLLQYLLPAFSGMQMMSLLEIRPQQNLKVYAWFFIFALITGLLSGILPSVFISRFQPASVLKGITNIRLFSRLTLRKILLIIQFIFSIVFIISIILISRQMNYMINAEMGFDREVVYDLQLQGQDINRVKNEYSQLPEISCLSAGSHVPGVGNSWGVDIRLNFEDEKFNGDYFSVDENYIKAMGLELIAGSDFPANMTTTNEKFVICNEKTVSQFNLGSPVEAIGKSLILDDSTLVEIIGVIKDYQYNAMFLNLNPLLLRVVPDRYHIAVLRLDSREMPATINKMKHIWKNIDTDHEMKGDFLDAEIREYYSFFEDIVYTIGFTALLAIIIACLGLLGMATYSTQTRTKEIGIRKVFGASLNSIILLISRSYLWLMLIAAIIGGPLAYFANNTWLQYMVRRVNFGLGTIMAGITVVVLIGLLTINSQTFRAARANPVDTLRYE
jgi:putative ABC transport system permease protein